MRHFLILSLVLFSCGLLQAQDSIPYPMVNTTEVMRLVDPSIPPKALFIDDEKSSFIALMIDEMARETDMRPVRGILYESSSQCDSVYYIYDKTSRVSEFRIFNYGILSDRVAADYDSGGNIQRINSYHYRNPKREENCVETDSFLYEENKLMQVLTTSNQCEKGNIKREDLYSSVEYSYDTLPSDYSMERKIYIKKASAKCIFKPGQSTECNEKGMIVSRNEFFRDIEGVREECIRYRLINSSGSDVTYCTNDAGVFYYRFENEFLSTEIKRIKADEDNREFRYTCASDVFNKKFKKKHPKKAAYTMRATLPKRAELRRNGKLIYVLEGE